MNHRLRTTGIISFVLDIIALLILWLGGHYLVLKVLGFLIFSGSVLYLTIILLRSPSVPNKEA
jgi:FtsH-binding integral membrane protein